VGLIAELGAGSVAVDTAVFIYFIEEHPRFLPVILPLFTQADQGKRELITSALTLLEVLVVPYRAGNRRLADRYEALLTRSRGFGWSSCRTISCEPLRNFVRRPTSRRPTHFSSSQLSAEDAKHS
jgi:predicted nucleic acid-binding protein